jgi:hypothetical protein
MDLESLQTCVFGEVPGNYAPPESRRCISMHTKRLIIGYSPKKDDTSNKFGIEFNSTIDVDSENSLHSSGVTHVEVFCYQNIDYSRLGLFLEMLDHMLPNELESFTFVIADDLSSDNDELYYELWFAIGQWCAKVRAIDLCVRSLNMFGTFKGDCMTSVVFGCTSNTELRSLRMDNCGKLDMSFIRKCVHGTRQSLTRLVLNNVDLFDKNIPDSHFTEQNERPNVVLSIDATNGLSHAFEIVSLFAHCTKCELYGTLSSWDDNAIQQLGQLNASGVTLLFKKPSLLRGLTSAAHHIVEPTIELPAITGLRFQVPVSNIAAWTVKCPNLIELEVSLDFMSRPDHWLLENLRQVPRLQQLSVVGSTKLSDVRESWKHMMNHMPRLISVKFSADIAPGNVNMIDKLVIHLHHHAMKEGMKPFPAEVHKDNLSRGAKGLPLDHFRTILEKCDKL